MLDFILEFTVFDRNTHKTRGAIYCDSCRKVTVESNIIKNNVGEVGAGCAFSNYNGVT